MHRNDRGQSVQNYYDLGTQKEMYIFNIILRTTRTHAIRTYPRIRLWKN